MAIPMAPSPLAHDRPHPPGGPAAARDRRANHGLLLFRAVLTAVCLALLSIDGVAGPLQLGRWWVLWGVVAVAATSALFYALTRWWRHYRAILAAQVTVDLLLVGAMIYLTGGVDSIFVFLPFAYVLTVAVVLGATASLLYASLATVLLAAISVVYSLGCLGVVRLPWIASSWLPASTSSLPRALAMVVGQGVALHAVALLGGNLAARLRRETSLKEEILGAIAEGLIVVDAGRRVVYINDEAVGLLGFPSADGIIGRRWEDIFRRRGDRQVRHMLIPGPPGNKGEAGPFRSDVSMPEKSTREDVLAPRSRVIEFDHRERGKLYLSVKTSPFRRRDDALEGVVAIFHDITAQRVMEAVQERAERLQEISLVAAGIAHELRNPLASIRGCVQELASIEMSNPQSRRLANIVTTETDRLDKIITEFLNFARMRPPRPVSCGVHEVIEEVIVLLQAGRRLDAIEIETDAASGLRVVADRDQLKQVLLNLVRNAVDAMPKGGRLRVSAARTPRMPGQAQGSSDHHESVRPGGISSSPPAADQDRGSGQDTGAVRIDVTDAGVGISPEHLESLFTPFFTTKPHGTGMGLSIVERIVRAHDGHLEVESQLGLGSTFRLWLPAVPRRRRVQPSSLWQPNSAPPLPVASHQGASG